MDKSTKSTKLEVDGGWFVFPLNRVPKFVWIFLPLFAVGWIAILLANGQFPVDPRFYGTWDVYIGGEHRNSWTLSPPGLFGGKLKDETESQTVQWGVRDGLLVYGVGHSRRFSVGLRTYKIVEVSDNRILLARNKDHVELRRRE